MAFEYAEYRRIVYGEGATFVPVCQQCGRFVKADPVINFRVWDGQPKEPNALCAHCGRVAMRFEGYY